MLASSMVLALTLAEGAKAAHEVAARERMTAENCIVNIFVD
jgi:hypothetical protein